MYAKVNWENQTVEFISNEEAEKMMHSPLVTYCVNDDWFYDGWSYGDFETVEDVLNYLMENRFNDIAEMVIEDDWFEEQHPDFFNSDDWKWDSLLAKKDWLYDWLVHYAADIVKPFYADCACEFIKVPETAS